MARGVVEVDLGGGRAARALIDTAGTALCIDQALADELGLTLHERLEQQGTVVSVLDAPDISLGGFALDTDGLAAYGFDDLVPLGLAARRAQLVLPAPLLRRHHVVLDAPAGRCTIATPGSAERRGVAVPCDVDPDTGSVVALVEIDGETFELLVDAALTCCLAVDGLMRAWQGDHPSWPASAAAVGPGNVAGLPAEARLPMLRIPAVGWGSFVVPDVAFAWRRDADLPTDGALGANVLDLFRVELDYAGGSVRLEQGRPFAEPDGDLVGVVLALGEDGWEVAATVSGLDDVQVGDVLVAVDGTPCAASTLPDVLDLLRGEVGSPHVLSLRRGGDAVEVTAPVLRLL
jgi:hypothetical protein